MNTFTHLLDTNIVSEIIRKPQGIVAQHIRTLGEKKVCTSIIVASEIRYGCAKNGSEKLTRQADMVLAALTVLPLDPPVDSVYGTLRHTLESKGQTIGPNDLFIAAHALSLGLTLVTANHTEFSRVPGLQVENWLDGV